MNFAPMEGITGYIYRNAHRKFFKQMDLYFTPFIVPNQNRRFTSREKNDFLPQHNEGLSLVPQILTKNSEDFIWAAKELKEYGYGEINLNLGCPSATVAAKGRGSGFLAQPEQLDRFFEDIFSGLDMEISVKTRLGKDNPEEFYRLLEIYNKYPLKELIVHPRVQKDFYRNEPDLKMFQEAVLLSRNPLCYNGNLFSAKDYGEFADKFPTVDRVMFGRGLVADPGLAGEIRTGEKLEKEMLKAFHDEVLKGYEQTISGDRNILFKMKELWGYMISLFEDGERAAKKIRKAQHLSDYQREVDRLFQDGNFKKNS